MVQIRDFESKMCRFESVFDPVHLFYPLLSFPIFRTQNVVGKRLAHVKHPLIADGDEENRNRTEHKHTSTNKKQIDSPAPTSKQKAQTHQHQQTNRKRRLTSINLQANRKHKA